MSKNQEATSGVDSIIASINEKNVSKPTSRESSLAEMPSNTKHVAIQTQKTNKGRKERI